MKAEEIEKHKQLIDKMSVLEMAALWRFAPSGHKYFRRDEPEIGEYFSRRFHELGGMTPAISKIIGW